MAAGHFAAVAADLRIAPADIRYAEPHQPDLLRDCSSRAAVAAALRWRIAAEGEFAKLLKFIAFAAIALAIVFIAVNAFQRARVRRLIRHTAETETVDLLRPVTLAADASSAADFSALALNGGIAASLRWHALILLEAVFLPVGAVRAIARAIHDIAAMANDGSLDLDGLAHKSQVGDPAGRIAIAAIADAVARPAADAGENVNRLGRRHAAIDITALLLPVPIAFALAAAIIVEIAIDANNDLLIRRALINVATGLPRFGSIAAITFAIFKTAIEASRVLLPLDAGKAPVRKFDQIGIERAGAAIALQLAAAAFDARILLADIGRFTDRMPRRPFRANAGAIENIAAIATEPWRALAGRVPGPWLFGGARRANAAAARFNLTPTAGQRLDDVDAVVVFPGCPRRADRLA